MLKSELYEIIKKHKPREKKYEIDRMAREHGHTVVRLPPYHCDLNPIELIWANVKNYVARHNTTWKMKDVAALCEQAVQSVTVQNWKDAIAHCEKLEEEYWKRDGIIEETVGELIISLGESDSDSNSDSDSENEESETEEQVDVAQSLGCTPLPSD